MKTFPCLIPCGVKYVKIRAIGQENTSVYLDGTYFAIYYKTTENDKVIF